MPIVDTRTTPLSVVRGAGSAVLRWKGASGDSAVLAHPAGCAGPPVADGRRGRLLTGARAMDFKAWIAEIEDTVTFVVEPDEWRKYYDAGLSPRDAIAQRVADEEI